MSKNLNQKEVDDLVAITVTLSELTQKTGDAVKRIKEEGKK